MVLRKTDAPFEAFRRAVGDLVEVVLCKAIDGCLWIANRIDSYLIGREEMVVEITKRDVNGKGTEAKIFAESGAVIVAHKIGFAEWEALYGESQGSRIDLPSCFTLNGETMKALEDAAANE